MDGFSKVIASRLGTKARVVVLDLRGAGAEGDDANAEFTPDVESAQPIGFVSRPVPSDTLEALVIRIGDEDLAIHVIDKGSAKLTDLEEGESRLYGPKEPSAVIRIRANGDIELTPKSGRDVILAGGSAKIARVGDATAGHAHSVVFALTAPPGGGAVTGTITINSNTDTINAGADHVKA